MQQPLMEAGLFWIIIGTTAACLTMFAFIPQIIKALRTKSVKDMSIFTLVQLSLGVSLWVAYGIYLKNSIIILANSFSLMTLIMLLVLYFIYKRRTE